MIMNKAFQKEYFSSGRKDILSDEDPLVLEYLKWIQDCFSPSMDLVPSQEDNSAHTFNNSLAAIAFILKGEKERAERILDFYAGAAIEDNTDPLLQNFYLSGEARGFYQTVLLRDEGGIGARRTAGFSDRWMGDMAWLALAYKHYEKRYGNKDKPSYESIALNIIRLLKSFFIKTGSHSGYVGHGWRWGPLEERNSIEADLKDVAAVPDFLQRYRLEGIRHPNIARDKLSGKVRNDDHLHEINLGGHHEGNIDCYAAFKAFGEYETAEKLRLWLESEIDRLENDKSYMPLDLYSWRALAFGEQYPELYGVLYQTEKDQRYRKSVIHNGKSVTGFYHGPEDVCNIWSDGTAHIACGFFAAGDEQAGSFYANQLDHLIIERKVKRHSTDDITIHAIPYTSNKSGGYSWVNHECGFSSAAAWYIFAKNRFNPMSLETYCRETLGCGR